MPAQLNLLPQPRSATLTGGTLDLHGSFVALNTDPAAALWPAGECVQQALRSLTSLATEILGGANSDAAVTITLGDGVGHAQGYRLSVAADGITIAGDDAAGAYYGAQTLAQLLQTYGKSLPLLVIEDFPDFPARGVMLDISRDKVPSMDTLYGLIDWLASLKINQFQLYTEHTFAYRNHPTVWAKASPITAEQILQLDAFCKARYIELVPNQNSFGHMWRWLKLPEYADLAETHERVYEWMSEVPFTLDPGHPGSLKLLESMYDELLPNFTSKMFNVGADETWDLGTGRSKANVEAKGKGRVYLDFVLEIYKRVTAHGRTMQFWGDIINQYPELVPEIPKDVIALEWGYEADHPFAEKSELFAKSGVPFYVCPGTSTWTTLSGRTDNMKGNIRNSIENGLKFGAIGVLNTDWGDRGHWQQLPISYPGYAYGAALSWYNAGNSDVDLQAALDAFAFGDSTGIMGKLAADLGNTYQQPGVIVRNGNFLHWIYTVPLEQMRHGWRRSLSGDSAETLNNNSLLYEALYGTMEYIDNTMQPLASAQINRPDADLIKREFEQSAHMLKHGAKRALLQIGDEHISKAEMLADLDALIEEQKALWLARNRPGGLDDSLAALEAARELYK
ncbi:MAG: family 20 glycosylhydrolase [Chloroflexi bacterium]|nr:family 20 glycosylhydrolase [Chloroflexota bacterium]